MAEKTKKRSAVVACLLGLVHLGMGLLYIGRPGLALAAPLAPFGMLLLARVTGIALTPLGLVAGIPRDTILRLVLDVGFPGFVYTPTTRVTMLDPKGDSSRQI